MASLRHAQLQWNYRFISAAFAVLVLGLIGGIAYAAWSKTTIVITPRRLPVSAAFTVTIAPTGQETTGLTGTVTAEQQSATVTVEPKQSGATVPAHATGRVIFTNRTAKDQPLAAGTRLRSAGGVIVRTTARVDVPAGGTVSADIVADPLGADGNVPPGRFIIVALWPGLQDKIYADSATAFSGGLASGGSTLSIDDLTEASNRATKQITDALPPAATGTLVTTSPVSVTTNPKPETPSASYAVTVKLKVLTIAYRAADLDTLMRTQLRSTLADDQELMVVDQPTITAGDQPTVDSVVLAVKATGQARLSAASSTFQAQQFTGLSAADIRAKLLGSNGVKSAVIRFAPWWRRNAPDQPERILVKLLPAQS